MRILIALDTNQINTNNYKTGRPAANFDTVVNYIRDNKLEDQINIIVPETVTRELFRHMRESYNTDVTTLINITRSMDKTPTHEIKLTLPNTEDYYKYIRKQINNELLKYSFIKIPKLPTSKKIETLNSLIENCDDDQTRFHDQLIIEEIKHYKYFNNYDRVLLFSDNAKDFREYLPSNIELYTSWEEMKQTLDAIFIIGDTEEETKFKRFIETTYAKEQMEDTYFSGTYSTIKIQEILSCNIVLDTEAKHGEKYAVIIKAFNNQYKREEKITFLYDNTNTIIRFELIYQ